MPKLNKVLANTIEVKKPVLPFIDDGTIYIRMIRDDNNRITKIEAKYKDQGRDFEVKKFNVLKAWQEMEQWFESLN